MAIKREPTVIFNVYDTCILDYNDHNYIPTLNSISTSGYALELYTFKFKIVEETIPDYISNNIFVWEFGDGEYSTDISPTHWYKAPGKYNVTLTLYGLDENNRYTSYLNKYSVVMDIYNFVPNYEYNTYGDVISGLFIEGIENDVEKWQESPLIKIQYHLFNSWQSAEYTDGIYKLNLKVIDSQYPLLKINDYNSNAYLHLTPTDKFLDTDLQPINSISAVGEPLFYTRNFSGCMQKTENVDGATFIGYATSGEFYYSGVPNISSTDKTILEISLDTTGFKEPYEINNNIKTIYKTPILLTNPFRLEFTNVLSTNNIENNLSGFVNTVGIYQPSFDIYKYKYINTPINFVFRYSFLIDNEYYPLSFLNNMSISSFNNEYKIIYDNEIVGDIRLKDDKQNNIPCEFISDIVQQPENYYTDKGGYLKGICRIDNPIKNAHIEIILNKELLSLLPMSSFNISSFVVSSNDFDVIEPNSLEIRKINENFNLYEQFEKVSLQKTISESTLLNSYMSSIIGEMTSPNSINIKSFEKIANYVINIDDIDLCNVECLYNHFYALGYNISDNNYSWPPNFRRVVDLFSIPYHKLRGAYGTKSLDFDKKGYNNDLYGRNLGQLIDISTYIVSAGKYIVAKEKFSGIYTLINTNLVVNLKDDNLNYYNLIYPGIYKKDNIYCYPLSAYTNDKIIKFEDKNYKIGWGWNLILPDNYKLADYYEFYEYIPTEEEFIYNNIIDWSNKYNKININDIKNIDDWEEIKKKYIMQNLYTNLII